MTNYPKILVTALSKYKKVTNRCEVITYSMFEYINNKASAAELDSLERSFKDRAVCSRYFGPWLSEWCQTTKTKFKMVKEGLVNEALAITSKDITFYDATGKLINSDRQTMVRVAYAEVI